MYASIVCDYGIILLAIFTQWPQETLSEICLIISEIICEFPIQENAGADKGVIGTGVGGE